MGWYCRRAAISLLLPLLFIWHSDVLGVASLALTPDEKKWLGENHVVRVRIPDYPPYMMNASDPEGMSVDYIKAIAQKVGFQVQFLPAVTPWSAALKDVMGPREHYDLLR